jgi:hypothetical protein
MKDPSEKREYFRVHTQLRVGMRSVARGELDAVAAGIVHREPSPPARIDPELAQWIGRIEHKLDVILTRLGAANEAGILPGATESVVLSGGGLLLPSNGKSFPHDTKLLIEFTLPETPMRRIRAICSVVRETNDDDGIPLVFSCINESDRDAVIRHCLAVQRSELRRAEATRAR